MITKLFSTNRRLPWLFALPLGLMIGSAAPADAFDMAFGDEQSPAYSLGIGISSLVKIKLLPSKDIDLQSVITEGDQASMDALESGQVSFALVAMDENRSLSGSGIEAVANLGDIGSRTTMLLARSDVDDESVRAILATIFENITFLSAVNPGLNQLDADSAVMGLTLPLHDGAKQFYATWWSSPGAATAEAAGTTAPEPNTSAPAAPQPAPPAERSLATAATADVAQAPSSGPADARNYVVYFGFDRSSLDQEAETTLEEAAAFASTLEAPAIIIAAYTDSAGDAEYNYSLAERRAESVRLGLEQLNVRYSRVDLSLFGERSPWSVTLDGVDEANNRRVELFIEEPVPTVQPLPIPAGFSNEPPEPPSPPAALENVAPAATPAPAGGPVQRLKPSRPLM